MQQFQSAFQTLHTEKKRRLSVQVLASLWPSTPPEKEKQNKFQWNHVRAFGPLNSLVFQPLSVSKNFPELSLESVFFQSCCLSDIFPLNDQPAERELWLQQFVVWSLFAAFIPETSWFVSTGCSTLCRSHLPEKLTELPFKFPSQPGGSVAGWIGDYNVSRGSICRLSALLTKNLDTLFAK